MRKNQTRLGICATMPHQTTLEAGGSIEEGGLKISVAEDGLSATALLDVRLAGRWTVERALQFLNRHGVTDGILPTALAGMFRDNRFGVPVVIARGTPVTEGKPAHIKCFFEYDKVYKDLLKCRDPETFAREALHRFSITREKPIAIQTPGSIGEDGKDVFGNVLPAESSLEERLTPGPGTMLSANSCELLPERDGVVSYDGVSFRVVGAKIHDGDISPSSGEQILDGTLAIPGSVRSDAVVRATGDVIVGEAVEAAEIYADGSVLIAGTMDGGRRGCIKAGGHVLLRSVKHSEISAGKNIWFAGSVVQSNLKAGDIVCLFGGNGRVLGGTIQAEYEIYADEIGSKKEVGTTLILGQEMTQLSEHAADMKAQWKEKADELTKARSLATALKELRDKLGILPPDKEQILMTSVRTEWAMRGQAELLRREVSNLEARLREMRRREHVVRCSGTIWPGAEIRAGGVSHRVEEPVSNCQFVFRDARIERSPLDEAYRRPKLLARVHDTSKK